jgi:antitoxin component YwqK of YwqJK toxin-antitoxin module
VGAYVNGKEDKLWSSYYPNKQLQQEEEWNKGHLIKIGDYFAMDGRELNKGTFRGGDGSRITYYASSNMAASGEFSHGLPNGGWTYYHENGKTSAEGILSDGLRQGKWRFFRESGKLEAEGPYKDDQIVGKWKFYNEKGKLVEEKTMD